MPSIRICRALFYALAAAVVALAVIRLVQVVPSGEGTASCGPGWTRDYEGPCDAALKARQYEVGIEALLAVVLVGLGTVVLRDDHRYQE